jgi:FolB domain-containing protein
MDRIWLYGIECRCRIGVPVAERRKPQELLIDVGLHIDTAPAAARDDFRLTADYWAVEKAVRQTAETGERRLVEALAEQIAKIVLAMDKKSAAVTVIVHKKAAVMPRTCEVTVEITRRRGGR